MKIAKIEDLHRGAGVRDFSFLKITTDDGLVGWSEYNEGYGSAGLTAVIRRIAQELIGQEPLAHVSIVTEHDAITRQAAGWAHPPAHGLDRDRFIGLQGEGAGHSVLRPVRGAGARSPAALLVALR